MHKKRHLTVNKYSIPSCGTPSKLRGRFATGKTWFGARSWSSAASKLLILKTLFVLMLILSRYSTVCDNPSRGRRQLYCCLFSALPSHSIRCTCAVVSYDRFESSCDSLLPFEGGFTALYRRRTTNMNDEEGEDDLEAIQAHMQMTMALLYDVVDASMKNSTLPNEHGVESLTDFKPRPLR